MTIPISGLTREIGAGDIIATVAEATGLDHAAEAAGNAAYRLGLKKTPGCGCKERHPKYNRTLSFTPRSVTAASNGWTKPPETPEGWQRIDTRGEWSGPALFQHVTGRYIIWQIAGGEYTRSYSFCRSCAGLAHAKFRELTHA